jgi:FKBP-type peptidyl-prolyl cis-trans isomerase SlyD
MKIADNSVVSLDYSLHLGDGVIIDKSEPGDPLVYLHGSGQIVPGLEDALSGMEVGQSKKVSVTPAEGYGVRDETRVQVLPKEAFGGQPVKAGDELIAVNDDGDQVPLKIVSIAGDKVTVDFNHPLAGATLHFSVEVKEVRAATAEELEHGHVHGPGGEH